MAAMPEHSPAGGLCVQEVVVDPQGGAARHGDGGGLADRGLA